MRHTFKKGSKVEVWSKREVPYGSWCYAEILSGNGRTYCVKYDPCTWDMGGAVERVPRKSIRPCPPLLKIPLNWVPDAVEFFDKYSWKVAEVAGKAVAEGYYVIRFLGSSEKFIAHVSKLRLRLSWEDGQWVTIGQDLGKHTGEKARRPPNEGNLHHQVKKNQAGNHFPIGKDDDFKELHLGFSRGMKRRPQDEACSGVVKKMRAVEKVDAVASRQTMLGGKYMHTSINNRTTRISEADTGKKIPNADDMCYFVPILDSSDTESIASSSGSCSPYRLSNPTNGLFGELGSPSMSRIESPPPTEKDVADEIHRLELHAYRATLVALHASGPISWEQEALISSLRLMLHISTDEHLMELRNLVPPIR